MSVTFLNNITNTAKSQQFIVPQIPPNREFLAILGDQKSGRNFEAPESTLRQLIREELSSFGGNGGGSYQFTANLDGRVLFDKIIDRAKLKQTLTGKNPFELG